MNQIEIYYHQYQKQIRNMEQKIVFMITNDKEGTQKCPLFYILFPNQISISENCQCCAWRALIRQPTVKTLNSNHHWSNIFTHFSSNLKRSWVVTEIILFLSFNISILSKFPINVRSLLNSEYLLSQPSLMGETSLLKSSIREEGKCFQSWKVCTFS